MAKAQENKSSVPSADKYKHLPTKSAKIRAMAADGFTRVQIAGSLGLIYQHVRNVLVTPLKSKS